MKSGFPVALTIAGSDSGGGAGIQADLKTFTAHGVYGMSAVTSVTAQNTRGVVGAANMDPEFVALQIRAVMEDIGADAAKLGMLATEGIIRTVAATIEELHMTSLVVDPVMAAKGGDRLLEESAWRALVEHILPLALVVTPNIPEAAVLTGSPITTEEDMAEAARVIKSFGPGYVVIKGGHLEGSDVCRDLLFDGVEFREYSAPRVDTPNTHGTGCTFSAAICANLALGMDVPGAVEGAKRYVQGAIEGSLGLGGGHGPLNHMWELRRGD